jgi:hypothetical protein
MDNKAFFITVHDKMRTTGSLKVGDWMPIESEFEKFKRQCMDEKKRQDEFFAKQEKHIK